MILLQATWNRKRFEVEDNDGDNNGANEKKERRKEKRKRKKEKKSRPQYSDEEDAQVEEEVEDVRPETPEDDAQDALAAAFGDSDEEAVPVTRPLVPLSSPSWLVSCDLLQYFNL